MASEQRTERDKAGLVTIKVDGYKARIAADLVVQTVERLKQQGATVVIEEER